jgi:hypothetical protein
VVKLSASPSGLHSALEVAEKKIGSFARNAGRKLADIGRIPGQVLSLPGAAVGGFLQPIQSLLSSIPLVGAAFAAVPLSGAAFLAFVKEGMGEIREIGKAADELGVSTEGMSTLLFAAGPASEAMVHGMRHLARELGEVREESAQVIGKFGALNQPVGAATKKFEALGLSGKDLAQMPLDQALEKVAQRAAGMGNYFDKVRLATGLFGNKLGTELLPLLDKLGQPGGMAALQAKGDQLGLIFGKGGLDEVRKAGAAMKEIDLIVTGFKRQLAIASAPFIAELAKGFTDLVHSAGGVRGIVIKVVEALGNAFVWLAEQIDEAIKQLRTLKETVSGSPGNFAKAVGGVLMLNPQMVGEGMQGLGGGGNIPEQQGLGLAGKAQALLDRALDALNGVGDGLKDVKEKANPAEEALAKFGDVAKAFDDADASTLDKFQAKIADLEKMGNVLDSLRGGKGAESHAIGLAKMLDELEASVGGPGHQLTGAALAGSQQALSDINKFNAQAGRQDAQTRIQNLLERAQQQRDQQLKWARETAEAVKNLKVANLGL